MEQDGGEKVIGADVDWLPACQAQNERVHSRSVIPPRATVLLLRIRSFESSLSLKSSHEVRPEAPVSCRGRLTFQAAEASLSPRCPPWFLFPLAMQAGRETREGGGERLVASLPGAPY